MKSVLSSGTCHAKSGTCTVCHTMSDQQLRPEGYLMSQKI